MNLYTNHGASVSKKVLQKNRMQKILCPVFLAKIFVEFCRKKGNNMKMGIKSNRLCSAGAALLILLTFLLSAFAGGSVYAETTSENQPIQISSAEELLQFAADAAKDSSINAELTADIDMTGKDAWLRSLNMAGLSTEIIIRSLDFDAVAAETPVYFRN